jgi:trans-aconitate methyltransferase
MLNQLAYVRMRVNSKYIAPRLGGLASRLAWKVRATIYQNMMHDLKPQENWSVLDVGVTSDQTEDSNFFEQLYPFKHRITAVGLEDASFLEQQFPGLHFIRADARALPFPDKSFDLAFCSAVIEHVGAKDQQLQLLSELARVSKRVVVTTPNRLYPLEFHTLTPLIHWLPAKLFRRYLEISGREFFSREENLNLLTDREMEAMFRQLQVVPIHRHHRLLGMKSNLIYYFSQDSR